MSSDKILKYLVQQVEKTGVGLSLTLCMNGLVIQGNIMNSSRYYDLMQDIINPKNIMRPDQELTKDPTEREMWNNYYANYKQFMKDMRRRNENKRDDDDVSDGKYELIPQEEIEAELRARKLIEFGDTGKTKDELLDQIRKSSKGLFKALLQKHMPQRDKNKDIDFIVDYLRPTREFRKSLMLELTEDQRTNVYNYMDCITQLAEDTINMIDEAENKK